MTHTNPASTSFEAERLNLRHRILIAEPLGFSSQALDILRSAGEVKLRDCSGSELAAAFETYDVVWIRLAHRVDRTMLPANLRCRILATPVTGLDQIDLKACAERGIRVISLRGETEFLREIRATAELTLALALALLRHVCRAASHVLDGGWNRDEFRGRELYGKTAGLVGVGRLGTLVAGYFRALGMEVLGYDPHANFDPQTATRVGSLPELLGRSDAVSLHVAYTEETRHLIGGKELAEMRPGAVLINTSRGGVVDETALLAALESGQLSGAALDVLEGEPNVTANHPLIRYAQDHDNLLIVPHIGGNTVESFEKTESFLARKVVEALRDSA